MEKTSKKERIQAVSAKLNTFEGGKINQKMIEAVLEADAEFITESLVAGYEVPIVGVGTFKLHEVAERPERPNTLPTCDKAMHDAVPAHSRASFKMTPSINKMIREKTLGNPFK